MSINSAEADEYQCPHCGAGIEEHDIAGRCPTADAFGESLEGSQ